MFVMNVSWTVRVGALSPVMAGLALALGACGAGERSVPATLVRDSAGITIVESVEPVWGDTRGRWITAEPEVEIGTLEGEEAYQLNQVRGATVLSDGRIVAVNAGSAELRYYDAEGRHLETVGRRGGGPGEFLSPGRVFRVAGDSILVEGDPGGRGLILFDPEGRYVRTLGPGAGDRGVGRLVGPLAGGGMVRRETTAAALDDGNGYRRDAELLIEYDPAGIALDTIALLPGSDMFQMLEESGGRVLFMSNPTPFARVQQVVLAGDLIYAGAGDSFEIEVYQVGGGGLQRLIRLSRPNRRVSSGEIAEFRRVQLDRPLDDNMRRRVERYLADVTYPKEMPAYRTLRVDAVGNLWVEVYRAPGEGGESEWELFDPEGRWLGTVGLPSGLELLEIGEDYLLALWTDELGVEYLRRYRLH